MTPVSSFFHIGLKQHIHTKMYNLKKIDDELSKLREKTGVLLRQKQRVLKQMTGMNFHNDSDIESHLNRTFSKPDEDYGQDEDIQIPEVQIPEEVRFIIMNGFNQKKGGQSENPFDDDDAKSENFQVIKNNDFKFKDVGGHDKIKEELMQCADLLTNYEKYSKYNVRTPKGLILEGPPGNGKTLLAKGFCGEIDVGFIPVSGSQFQEKYVGVGAARVRELFDLAKENVPCIIFMDEIDAIGRKRSGDDSKQDHDSTLNELLVNLDGFKSTNGIFIMGATNRIDLLDDALIRPGRVDKKIFVGNPDKKTREAIIQIHIKGKPHNMNVNQLVDLTNGYSGAQIENLLNEAMLYALRQNREMMTISDIEVTSNRILVGFQSTDSIVTPEILAQVATHEMGHALVGMFTKYKKLIKVTINLSSPTSLGFTLFEPNESQLITRQNMIHEIMTLLGGRVAEELLFHTLTTGASHDFSQAKKMAERMILDYGMGKKTIIPHGSEKYKEILDNEIDDIIVEAYYAAKSLLQKIEPLLKDCADTLVKEQSLKEEDVQNKIKNKYYYLF
uniref:AAA+ ATPase domain-containing protein n=1 Tax=viral metagenome TaxID=1070528 RepID=A0A6C0D1V0_9ZZZZ